MMDSDIFYRDPDEMTMVPFGADFPEIRDAIQAICRITSTTGSRTIFHRISMAMRFWMSRPAANG